jgi:hypothetical protein
MGMIRLYWLGILLFVSAFGFAQPAASEYGDVSRAELEMKYYEKDTTAAAVILFDKGHNTIDGRSTEGTTITRHVRIKLFKKNAFTDWGSMSFLVGKGNLPKVRGTTYNLENGRILRNELNEAHLMRSMHNKYQERVTLAFPNLKEGSVIELSYKFVDSYISLPSWVFQYQIPVRYSHYILEYPFEPYSVLLNGTITPSHNSKYDGKYQEWIMTDIPAFRPEPYMPDPNLYESSITFGTRYSSWGDVYRELMNDEKFWKIVEDYPYLKKEVASLTAGVTDPLQKIKIISDFIKANIKWSGYDHLFGNSPKEVFDLKTGDSGDINLIFASMLRKAGFVVNAVLISTQEYGSMYEAFPSWRQFNYVICSVTLDNKVLLLDATNKTLPCFQLPPRCYNHKGLSLSEEGYRWITIEPTQGAKTSVNANLSLSSTGDLSGKVNIHKGGLAGYMYRRLYTEVGAEKYQKEITEKETWMMDNFELLNQETVDKPLIENYELTVPEYAIISGDMMYINPFIFLREETNPFVDDKRTYPIEFRMLQENNVVSNITIPDDYAVEHLPEGKIFALPNNAAKCAINVTQAGNKVTVVSRFSLNKTLLSAEEYYNLKEFYALMVAKKAETIVLRKKKA